MSPPSLPSKLFHKIFPFPKNNRKVSTTDPILEPPQNYWKGKQLGEIFENGLFSDVAFVVVDNSGTDQRFPAHKVILATMSPVFHRMFCGELAENAEIRIADTSAKVFAEFLQLFYKRDVEIAVENISEVMRLIDRYEVNDLVDVVARFATEKLSAEKLCSLYESITSLPSSKAGAEIVLEAINRHAMVALKSSSFLQLSRENLSNILKSQQLEADEITVFEAAIAWTKNSLTQKGLDTSMENIRTEMGDLIKLIRFPAMEEGEFVKIMKSYPNVLDSDICMDIIDYIRTRAALTTAKDYNVNTRYSQKIFSPRVKMISDMAITSSVSTIAVTTETDGKLSISSFDLMLYRQPEVCDIHYSINSVKILDGHSWSGIKSVKIVCEHGCGDLYHYHIYRCKLKESILLDFTCQAENDCQKYITIKYPKTKKYKFLDNCKPTIIYCNENTNEILPFSFYNTDNFVIAAIN